MHAMVLFRQALFSPGKLVVPDVARKIPTAVHAGCRALQHHCRHSQAISAASAQLAWSLTPGRLCYSMSLARARTLLKGLPSQLLSCVDWCEATFTKCPTAHFDPRTEKLHQISTFQRCPLSLCPLGCHLCALIRSKKRKENSMKAASLYHDRARMCVHSL
jgi:hypothetical protein